MAEREPRGDDENCDGPDAELKPGPSQDRQHWYSWSRWKYIGGGLFLLLSVVGVGYVVWDIIDLLPKPIADSGGHGKGGAAGIAGSDNGHGGVGWVNFVRAAGRS